MATPRNKRGRYYSYDTRVSQVLEWLRRHGGSVASPSGRGIGPALAIALDTGQANAAGIARRMANEGLVKIDGNLRRYYRVYLPDHTGGDWNIDTDAPLVNAPLPLEQTAGNETVDADAVAERLLARVLDIASQRASVTHLERRIVDLEKANVGLLAAVDERDEKIRALEHNLTVMRQALDDAHRKPGAANGTGAGTLAERLKPEQAKALAQVARPG